MSTIPIIKKLGISLLAASLLALPTLETTVAAAAQSSPYDPAFSAASQEFGVPEQILKALSYNQSRWSSNDGKPSIDGGYGVMNLTSRAAEQQSDFDNRHARGDDKDDRQKPQAPEQTRYTLDDAAQLLSISPDTLKTDQAQNIRGAAAALSTYAKELNDNKLPTELNGWYGALAAYSGSRDQTVADEYANGVYETVRKGAAAPDDNGKMISLPAKGDAQPDKRSADKLTLKPTPAPNNQQGAECPQGLNCRFIPAGYGQNDPNDPTLYGNYDAANRPADMKIQYIIIHDTEGSYASAIKHFQDTTSYVSSHYVIRSSDGAITQMVHNSDVSWGAGDWYVNMHGINIEHEGLAADGSKWYTDAMYKSSATLVRWLAAKYQIPLDRDHIIGHDNVPATTQAALNGQHWDPGPFWDWIKYMGLVQGKTLPSKPAIAPAAASIIVMSPNFATNRLTLQDCYTTPTCTDLPEQGTSIVQLHTQPSATSPLLTDATVHPDGAPGTNKIDDWSATASAGEQYVVADNQGTWVAIWFGGQKGWFNNPANKPVAFYADKRATVAAKTTAAIPVYGRLVPEASAFPQGVTPLDIVPLNYMIPAGQSYTALGGLKNDYYYDWTVDYSAPHDHEIFVGKTKYYQIQYNHRLVYVKASDVKTTGRID